jgi:hypothetical protein
MLSTTVLSLILIVTWYRGETQYRRVRRKAAAAAARARAMPKWADWLDNPEAPQDFDETYTEYRRRRLR